MNNHDIVAQAAQKSTSVDTVVKYWTTAEDNKLTKIVTKLEGKNWKQIALESFPDKSRSDIQCLHRWKKVLKPGLKKGPWTPVEDDLVLKAVLKLGIQHVKWSNVAALVNGRLGKQVRERWYNHLDPTLNKGQWTKEEDAALVKWQADFGNKWVKIADKMPGRSENGIKNRWNSAKRRRGGEDKRKGNSGKSKVVRKSTSSWSGKTNGGKGSVDMSSGKKRKATSSSSSSSSSSHTNVQQKKTKVDI
tara:strand:+ start:13 stop:753 length:741 start_codon:yes stop_codon:yes gene_type:complete